MKFLGLAHHTLSKRVVAPPYHAREAKKAPLEALADCLQEDEWVCGCKGNIIRHSRNYRACCVLP